MFSTLPCRVQTSATGPTAHGHSSRWCDPQVRALEVPGDNLVRHPDNGDMPLAPSGLTSAQRIRAVANAVNLSTPLGLAVSAIGRARVRRGPRGLILAEHYVLPFPKAGAFTLGNVVSHRTHPGATRHPQPGHPRPRGRPRLAVHGHPGAAVPTAVRPLLRVVVASHRRPGLGQPVRTQRRPGRGWLHPASGDERRVPQDRGQSTGPGHPGAGYTRIVTPSRRAERSFWRAARSRRSRFTSSGS